jgi:hypothetical protein
LYVSQERSSIELLEKSQLEEEAGLPIDSSILTDDVPLEDFVEEDIETGLIGHLPLQPRTTLDATSAVAVEETIGSYLYGPERYDSYVSSSSGRSMTSSSAAAPAPAEFPSECGATITESTVYSCRLYFHFISSYFVTFFIINKKEGATAATEYTSPNAHCQTSTW